MVISKNLISVIVPCYNQAQYLDECLQSVLEQTYPNWECIIVSDGSPDNTEEIAHRWVEKDPRFKYFYKENGGLSSARNYGLEKAVGDFIQFLDCDDLLEKNKLKRSIQCFSETIDIVVSGYRYFEDKEGPKFKRILGRSNFLPEVCLLPSDNIDLKKLFSLKNPFVVSAPVFRKKVFERVGLFSERLISLEDWEFNIRCALNEMIFLHSGYGEDDKVLIRLHDESMMRNTKNMILANKNLRKILNDNTLYVQVFGRKLEDDVTRLNWKELIALFIPPILLLIKKKYFGSKK